jgi:glutamate dehydrogenase (NAD(P)+)
MAEPLPLLSNAAVRDPGDQLVYTVGRERGILGCVVIDSLVAGRSSGGLRMLPDVEEAEVRGLAHAMTLKYGFLGLPQGGAKAGVVGDPEAPRAERQRVLAEFGNAITSLLRERLYAPHADMGTDNDDIRWMLSRVGIPIARRELRKTSSGYYTAVTVFCGVKRAAAHLGLRLSECSAAIEGFGSVGRPLAELLAEAGVSVVAISTSKGTIYDSAGLDIHQLISLSRRAGSQVVKLYEGGKRMACHDLFELPVEILCPCARHGSINMTNMDRIKAQIVCPGANNPVIPAAEVRLKQRGITCLPDFITNSGGVLGGTMEFASLSRHAIEKFIHQNIAPRIDWILEQSSGHNTPPREIAERMALSRFAEVRDREARPSPSHRVFIAALDHYRYGRIPGSLVAPLSLHYFRKTLARVGEP